MKPNYQLRRERELHGWSQARVAEEVGTNAPTVSRWERGIAMPTHYFREKLCALFDKDTAALGLIADRREQQHEEHDNPVFSSPIHNTIFDPAIPMLPALPKLVGRDDFLQRFKAHLYAGQQKHLMVFNGLPGVGKTALAMMLVHDPEIQELFADGILWVGLGPEPNIPSLLGRWGTLLNLSAQTRRTQEEWAQALNTAIGTRRMLLVIDDAWDVQDVLAFKVGGSQCAHLVTTRMPRVALHFTLNGLWHVPELNEQDSLTLLSSYVPELLQHAEPHARHLISAVGGLPLALTLMGKYLRVQSGNGHPRRLLEAIQQISHVQQRLYVNEPRSVIDRHPSLSKETPLSLHAIIAVSEHYMQEQGRQALSALSLFPPKPNSFSEEAALAISQVPARVLDELSDIGLLECPDAARYMLHCTIADYARMNLKGNEAIQRFVTYMLTYVEQHHADYEQLALESRNILKALEEAFSHDMQDEFVRGVVAIAPFLIARTMYALAETYLRGAYTITLTRSNQKNRLSLLAYLGEVCVDQNNYADAETYFQDGLSQAREQANDIYTCRFLMNLSELVEKRGELVQARVYLLEGQALAYRLQYRDRSFYHRMASEPENNATCVFTTEPQMMIRRGLLTNIDELFYAWKDHEAIAPVVLQTLMGPDGHIYGIPRGMYALSLIYNRRLFARAGLDPDQPPRTWQEFRTFAKCISDLDPRICGFAGASMHYQGGWHYTGWLYTAGVQVLKVQQGRRVAAFGDEKAYQALEMFREMRFSDQSLPQQTLLDEGTLIGMMAQGRTGMIVGQHTVIDGLYHLSPKTFADFGLAPMPQNGGNACLLGGTTYVFHRLTPSQAVHDAFHRIIQRYYNFERYEEKIQEALKAGEPMGLPLSPLLVGPLRQRVQHIEAQYCNVLPGNYAPYDKSALSFIPEPALEGQKYYRLADTLMQAALTDPNINLSALLEQVTEQYQQILDQIEDVV